MYERWSNGPPADPTFFPVAVWLQDVDLAARYRDAGVNVYVGLWQGPTHEQLAALQRVGMHVICEQNEIGLQHADHSTIIGWMHGDEPDNAQGMARRWKNDVAAIKRAWPDVPDRTVEEWGTYGPPIPPAEIVADYHAVAQRDPSRPVLLNLGQGVANDDYVGRGWRRGRMEDYPEYAKGCDIVSYDIYPVTHHRPEIVGNLWYVPRGVERLLEWTTDRQVVWNVVECTHINSDRKPTPQEVRTEVWMSLIHGSKGIVYFCHEWKPELNEHAPLDDPEMLAALTGINNQIHGLAPVLNNPTLADGVDVDSSNADVPVATMVKQHDGATYVFAVAMRDGDTNATFTVRGVQSGKAEVIEEDRAIEVTDGRFEDAFKGYEVHLYRVR